MRNPDRDKIRNITISEMAGLVHNQERRFKSLDTCWGDENNIVKRKRRVCKVDETKGWQKNMETKEKYGEKYVDRALLVLKIVAVLNFDKTS